MNAVHIIPPLSINRCLMYLQSVGGNLCDVGKMQVYQTILNIRFGSTLTDDSISVALYGIDEMYLSSCFMSFKNASRDASSSKLHNSIFSLVQSLGVVSLKEFVTNEGLSIDIAVLRSGSRSSISTSDGSISATIASKVPREDLILIEVDGPSHFNARTRKETMVSSMKKRILRGMGYTHVKSISYLQWKELKTRRDKLDFLEKMLL